MNLLVVKIEISQMRQLVAKKQICSNTKAANFTEIASLNDLWNYTIHNH